MSVDKYSKWNKTSWGAKPQGAARLPSDQHEHQGPAATAFPSYGQNRHTRELITLEIRHHTDSLTNKDLRMPGESYCSRLSAGNGQAQHTRVFITLETRHLLHRHNNKDLRIPGESYHRRASASSRHLGVPQAFFRRL